MTMVTLYDPPPRPSSTGPSSTTRFLPPLHIPPPISLAVTPPAADPPSRAQTVTYPRSPRPLRPTPTAHRRLPQKSPPVSKINLLDLATEVTAVIFRYAHKPKDFHYLLPSGAGPLTLRKYNLPLTVSKEWYRRVRPIYYETLQLTWYKLPDFVENVQRYEQLQRYIVSIHVRIVGQAVYKVVKGGGGVVGERKDGAGGEGRVSEAQLMLLLGQYIDFPLASFALCLDSLVCIRDLTLRFTECKGGEVSLQSISLHPLIKTDLEQLRRLSPICLPRYRIYSWIVQQQNNLL
jgi:hypothetical protein